MFSPSRQLPVYMKIIHGDKTVVFLYDAMALENLAVEIERLLIKRLRKRCSWRLPYCRPAQIRLERVEISGSHQLVQSSEELRLRNVERIHLRSVE